MAEVATWVEHELKGVDLGDKRLNKRLHKVLSDLSERPNLSIPAACGGHTEMTGAYRFYDNAKVDLDGVLAPHVAQTLQRARAQNVVVLVPDTTELDLTRPDSSVEGAGPLDSMARSGLHLHLVEAFTPEGLPLGAVSSEVWARDEESLERTQQAKRKQRKKAPIEEKESFRWLKGFREARAFAQQCPQTKCIYVADSESDIYEQFVEPRGDVNPLQWVIRVCQNRALVPKHPETPEEGTTQTRYIRERVAATPVLFTNEISVRGREAKVSCEARGRRQPRTDRKAQVSVHATTMTLRPPQRCDRKLEEVTVNIVLVQEINPPAGDEPVEWLLITTLPIASIEDVRAIIQFYTVRWMIEIVFRTLKSGCRVEKRRFETAKRFKACLGVYLIVTWRTLYVCRLGRDCPQMSCEAVFEPSEWKSVWSAVKGVALPEKPPPLQVMVRLIAQLGGYVNLPNRKDQPGAQTVWIGLQRMHDLAWAWDVFGPGAAQKDV